MCKRKRGQNEWELSTSIPIITIRQHKNKQSIQWVPIVTHDLGILSTCKRARKEALESFYSGNKFFIPSSHDRYHDRQIMQRLLTHTDGCSWRLSAISYTRLYGWTHLSLIRCDHAHRTRHIGRRCSASKQTLHRSSPIAPRRSIEADLGTQSHGGQPRVWPCDVYHRRMDWRWQAHLVWASPGCSRAYRAQKYQRQHSFARNPWEDRGDDEYSCIEVVVGVLAGLELGTLQFMPLQKPKSDGRASV